MPSYAEVKQVQARFVEAIQRLKSTETKIKHAEQRLQSLNVVRNREQSRVARHKAKLDGWGVNWDTTLLLDDNGKVKLPDAKAS